jgi:hypothetical protein
MTEPLDVEGFIRDYVVRKFAAFLDRAVTAGVIDGVTAARLYAMRIAEWREQWREEDTYGTTPEA